MRNKVICIISIIFVVMVPFIFTGCSTTGEGGTASGSGTGKLGVDIKFLPFSQISDGNFTIGKVEATMATTDTGYITIISGDKPFTLQDILRGTDSMFASIVPAGTYHRIRITLDDSTVTAASGELTVENAAGDTSGITFVVTGTFDVISGDETIVGVEVNTPASFTFTSSAAIFNGVGSIFFPNANSQISGAVLPASSGAIVTVFQTGTLNQVTSGAVDPSNGVIILRHIPEGTFDILISATGFNSQQINHIQILKGQTFSFGIITLQPI